MFRVRDSYHTAPETSQSFDKLIKQGYKGFSGGHNHRPLDIRDIYLDQSSLEAPHLARLALVNAPKSTGHSRPGSNSLAPAGNAYFTPASLSI